ncbi:MAG: hypothetical protein FJX67_13350 [Alphaproteobacteria bacterium]|nr:hypothetical protein [Alphaproteobacteria bacterium]
MPAGTASVKLEAGDAIVYPATRIHRVNPVTQGTRLAAITWGQSLVPEEAEREILADLNAAMGGLAQRAPGAPENDLLFKTYANLVRRWSRV